MDDKYIDIPITSKEDDLFGFKEVAKLLVSSIANPPNRSSITLGLEGSWGSGKSSILNLLQEELLILNSENKTNEIGIVSVSFSPWLITNRSALIMSFFTQLNQALDIAIERIPKKGVFRKTAISKKLKSAKKLVNQFSGIIATASAVISAIDPTALALGTGASANAINKYTLDSDLGIENLKSELKSLLAEIAKADPSFRILVIIDDLDRLEPDEALEVVRLVKAVADFPATFYLLSYDKNVIAKAIQESVKIDDGYVYLEKIIQFSFKVPPLEPFKLRKWLQTELSEQYEGEVDFGSHRAHIIFDRWGGKLLKTPRDVRRLLLSIQIIWPSLHGEVDLLDFVWLQIIKEKASTKDSDLYSWVGHYLQSLDAIAIGGTVQGKYETQEDLVNILSNIGWRTIKREDKVRFDFDMHNLDEILAGVTKSYLGELGKNKLWIYQFNEDELNKAIEQKRLGSPRHWRKFFALDVPSHALTDIEWLSLVEASKNSENELTQQIKTLLEISIGERTDIGDQIVERAIYGIRSGIVPNSKNWLRTVVELSETFEKFTKPDGIFGFSSKYEYTSKQLAREVIIRTKGKDRKPLLDFIFVDFGESCLVSRIIRDQMHNEKKNRSERESYLYLKPAEIKRYKASLSQLYSNLTIDKFLELHNPWDILYGWRAVSGSYEGPKNLILKSISTDEGLITTLESLRKVSSSTHAGVPHIREDELKHFVDPLTIKARLKKISNGNSDLAIVASKLRQVWDDSNR